MKGKPSASGMSALRTDDRRVEAGLLMVSGVISSGALGAVHWLLKRTICLCIKEIGLEGRPVIPATPGG